VRFRGREHYDHLGLRQVGQRVPLLGSVWAKELHVTGFDDHSCPSASNAFACSTAGWEAFRAAEGSAAAWKRS
jgi:hypothetical protein